MQTNTSLQRSGRSVDPLVRALRKRLGKRNVLSAPSDLLVYDCDAYTLAKQRPDVVVFPRSSDDVVHVVQLCNRFDVPIVARGAGTSLAGGCLPIGGGVVVSLTRMNRILDVDLRNRMAVVEPGVLNTRLAEALEETGYHFAPDPSSQTASTIGGNVGANAGGPHTLKYGVTVNHVLGLEFVTGDGQLLQVGPVANPAGIDLVGLLTGSEGTLAIVTKIWLRLTRNPQAYCTFRAVFNRVDDATGAVSEMIASGVVPAAVELMDRGILVAVEEAFGFGFPLDAEAVLVIEIDGSSAGIEQQRQRVVDICSKWQAREIRQAADAAERAQLWKCRKQAVAAVGRLSPNYCIHDGVVPRTQLPHILRRIAEIGRKHRVRVVNVAHAGDGNIHPLFLFDQRDREEVDRVLAAAEELLKECLACGGSITAEHGVGVEKLALMPEQFRTEDLEAMRRVRQAFNSTGVLGPGKLLPESPVGEAIA